MKKTNLLKLLLVIPLGLGLLLLSACNKKDNNGGITGSITDIDGNTYKTIVEHLEALGYHIKSKVLNTCKVTTVPQNCERIYIVCFKERATFDRFSFDGRSMPVCEPIKSFLMNDADVPEKYYYTAKRTTIYDRLKNAVTEPITDTGGAVYQYRKHYVCKNKSGVCPTLTANMGTGEHNVPIVMDQRGIRKLTPRECFNLQGFPKDYVLPHLPDSKLYCLAGNAVSIPVVSLIARRIVDVLLHTRSYNTIHLSLNTHFNPSFMPIKV